MRQSNRQTCSIRAFLPFSYGSSTSRTAFAPLAMHAIIIWRSVASSGLKGVRVRFSVYKMGRTSCSAILPIVILCSVILRLHDCGDVRPNGTEMQRYFGCRLRSLLRLIFVPIMRERVLVFIGHV